MAHGTWKEARRERKPGVWPCPEVGHARRACGLPQRGLCRQSATARRRNDTCPCTAVVMAQTPDRLLTDPALIEIRLALFPHVLVTAHASQRKLDISKRSRVDVLGLGVFDQGVGLPAEIVAV